MMQAVYNLILVYLSFGSLLFVLSGKGKKAHTKFESDILFLQKKYGTVMSLLRYGIYALLILFSFVILYPAIYLDEYFKFHRRTDRSKLISQTIVDPKLN